jgi:Flp pilus assembly protein TadG
MNAASNPRRVDTREHGQAAVEFALVVVSLVIVLISILEMTMFVYTYVALTNLAKEGVRYAVVHGSSAANPSASSDVAKWVNTRFGSTSLHQLSGNNISVTYPDGNSNSPGSRVQVTVRYPYQPIFGLRWASVTISANSVGRIMF